MSQSIQQAKLNNPKVTVIIPVYNAEKYLEECLDSVVSQDLNEIEILCIDDGSTDNSQYILKEYAAKDDRFNIVSQANKGAAASRNEGIRRSHGKYVMFMDSDDYYPSKGVIRNLYTIAEKYEVHIAGGEFSEISQHGGIRQGSDYIERNLYGYSFKKEGILHYYDYQFDYGFTRFIYNKLFLIKNDVWFPQLSFFEDPPFFCKAMFLANKFAVIDLPTYVYRVGHKETIWNETRTVDLMQGLLMDLKFAKDNDLNELYDLTIRRMLEDYVDVIQAHRNICNELYNLLTRNIGLFYDRNQGIYSQVLGLTMTNRGKEIYSISYKIGMLITWIPRRFIHFIKRK